MTKAEMMRKIQALDFAKCELALFLDTHPDSRAALAEFHKLCDELYSLRTEYENNYGAISWGGARTDSWNWIDKPWPWNLDFEEARD